MNTKTERQPVKRYYLLAVFLMFSGLAKFPWGQGASVEPSLLALPAALIALSVACVIRGLRNKREAQS